MRSRRPRGHRRRRRHHRRPRPGVRRGGAEVDLSYRGSPSTSPAPAGSSTTPTRSGRRSARRSPTWPAAWTGPGGWPPPWASPTSARRRWPGTGGPGAPHHRAVVWQDRRTASVCDELVAAGHLPLVRRRTGLVLDPYFSATKMHWLLTEGGVPDGPDLALGTVDAWLLWHLTGGTDGGVLATDVTNASRTLLLDITERAWSDELCDLFGVPVGALPEVRPSCGRFGTVHPSALGSHSPLAGLAIGGVAGDQHAALFGQACFTRGMAKVTYGTGSFVLMNAGPGCPPPADGLLTTLAWDLDGAVPGTGRPGRWPTPWRARCSPRGPPSSGCGTASASSSAGGSRAAGPVGRRQRGRHRGAGLHRAGQPLVGPLRPGHHPRPQPWVRPGPPGPGGGRGHELPGRRRRRRHGRGGGPPVGPPGRRGCVGHGPAPAAPGRPDPHRRWPGPAPSRPPASGPPPWPDWPRVSGDRSTSSPTCGPRTCAFAPTAPIEEAEAARRAWALALDRSRRWVEPD